jgi:phosphatidylserine decarboxylase
MFFIEADNLFIGMMCVLPVGMAEVGTCDITVKEGQHVKNRDEPGMFHYGGSTCCLIFRKGVDLIWDMHGQEGNLGPESMNIPVNERIARVLARDKEGKGMRKRLLNVGVGAAFSEEGRRAFREEAFYR